MSDKDLVLIAFNVSREQLANQKRDLWQIRSQAFLLAGLSGLTATFFSRIVDEKEFSSCFREFCVLGYSPVVWLVFAMFLVSLLYSAQTLFGWQKCIFELEPKWIVNEQLKSTEPDAVLRQLARDADDFFDANENVIRQAMRNIRNGASAVLAQIIAWILLLLT